MMDSLQLTFLLVPRAILNFFTPSHPAMPEEELRLMSLSGPRTRRVPALSGSKLIKMILSRISRI